METTVSPAFSATLETVVVTGARASVTASSCLQGAYRAQNAGRVLTGASGELGYNSIWRIAVRLRRSGWSMAVRGFCPWNCEAAPRTGILLSSALASSKTLASMLEKRRAPLFGPNRSQIHCYAEQKLT